MYFYKGLTNYGSIEFYSAVELDFKNIWFIANQNYKDYCSKQMRDTGAYGIKDYEDFIIDDMKSYGLSRINYECEIV